MHIFDLPPELVDHILYFSIFERDIKRALRLKLVCRVFYIVFDRILFRSGFLDNYFHNMLFEYWHTRKYHGADRLWHDYLVFNCLNLPRPSVRRFVEIRDVADALLQYCETQERQHDLNFNMIIDRLCWLGLRGANETPYKECGREHRRVPLPSNPGLNLLSAATYFGWGALVQDLLDQGYDPLDNGRLFPCPMYIAAWTGQADLLQLMQETLPDLEAPRSNQPYAYFRSKIGPGFLEGAAARGDIDMVRLALYPPSRAIQSPNANNAGDGGATGAEAAVPNSELVIGQTPGSIEPHSKLGLYILMAMTRTRSPEVYEYLKTFLNEDWSPYRKSYDLATRAEAGDVVMVRHLLETGADPSPSKTDMDGGPLNRAVSAWHEGVIDVLLEHGADPTSAARAVVRSSLVLQSYTLWYAIRKEHTAMTEMLLRMEVNQERAIRLNMQYARDNRLESMAELLERWLLERRPSGC